MCNCVIVYSCLLSSSFIILPHLRSKEELDEVLQHAKVLTPQEKEARGPTTLLSRAKEELVRRQSSQRYAYTVVLNSCVSEFHIYLVTTVVLEDY